MSENCNGHCEHCAGHNSDADIESNVITLTDDEGNDVDFECLMTFDHGDHFMHRFCRLSLWRTLRKAKCSSCAWTRMKSRASSALWNRRGAGSCF